MWLALSLTCELDEPATQHAQQHCGRRGWKIMQVPALNKEGCCDRGDE